MKIKIAAVTLAIMLTPAVSLAGGCNYGKDKQAMSCADGTAYDSATGTCVAVNA